MDYKSKLDQVRKELDVLDAELLEYFEKRMILTDQVAEIKREGNIALTDENREQAVVDDAVSRVSKEYKGETIAYMRSIMGLSKMRQRKILLDQFEDQELLPPPRKPVREDVKVAFQGVNGAWGEVAAMQFNPNAEREGLNRFEDVFVAVKSKKFNYGVIPIENSRTGAIGEVYDLLREYGCYIVAQTWVEVDHVLMATPGTKLEEVREVFSHPEGFRQCDGFIKKFSWDLTMSRNTAVAAQTVKEKNNARYAAIGSRRAAELNGLEVIATDIIDDKKNRTRFIIIADQPEYNASSNIVSVIFRTAHRSGALCDVLFPLMSHDVNLSRIESRPMSGGRYCFFTDVDGNINDEKNKSALMHAASVCGHMEVLGCYSEI